MVCVDMFFFIGTPAALVEMKWAAETVAALRADVGLQCVCVCCLGAINIAPVSLTQLSESSMLTDDLFKRERNGRRGRREG